MGDFDVEFDQYDNAKAVHREYGHEYEFVIVREEKPHVRGGTVRQNQRADRDYHEFAEAARAAVEKAAREKGLIL